jgi:hypothetical protein
VQKRGGFEEGLDASARAEDRVQLRGNVE